MSNEVITIELSQADWERVCRGLDLVWSDEELEIEQLEDLETTYGEDWSEEIDGHRTEQDAARRVLERIRASAGIAAFGGSTPQLSEQGSLAT